MIWLLWFVSVALGGTLSDADDRFTEGDLDGAVALLEPVADGGWGSGKLHFNLGNVYYRKGDIPRAIAHYRAAQRLRPRDGHVHHNLALARSELKGLPDPVDLPSAWMSLVTPGELATLGFLSTSAGMIWVVAWYRRRDRMGLALPGLSGVALGLVMASAGAWGLWEAQQHPVAVVVAEGALVRDAARTDGAERFRLAPGAEVSVVRALGAFLLVEDGDGRRGWMSVSVLDIGA